MNINDYQVDPIVDSLRMKERLCDVSDKRGKIARMIHAGQLLRLRRGLYATRSDIHPYCLAASIYGPSYVSFETALSFHGLIPDAVYEIMSATLKRAKEFEKRYIYSHDDPEEFAASLEQLSRDDDLWRRISQRGLALIERQYAWDKVAAPLAALWESIANG